MDESNLTKLLVEQTITDSKLFLVLIGGVVGFLSAVFKDYLLEGKKEKIKQKNFKREKLEEAFIFLDKTFVENLTPIENRNETEHISHIKLTLIIKFYFPHLTKDLENFIESYAEAYRAHLRGEITSAKEQMTSKDLNTFAKKHKMFSDLLVKESKKLSL